MNIKSMLVRLQSAMGRTDLIQQMVLLSEPAICPVDSAKSSQSINLVVGYNKTPSSQTALDITLWIAHQTRLVTQKQVTVHIVYVVDDSQSKGNSDIFNLREEKQIPFSYQNDWKPSGVSYLTDAKHSLTQSTSEVLVASPEREWVNLSDLDSLAYNPQRFEQADRILWHARCLANEWGSSFTAHLRFGRIATELRQIVESELADVLLLGCHSAEHPIIQELGFTLPCPVLGIPTVIGSPEKSSCFNR